MAEFCPCGKLYDYDTDGNGNVVQVCYRCGGRVAKVHTITCKTPGCGKEFQWQYTPGSGRMPVYCSDCRKIPLWKRKRQDTGAAKEPSGTSKVVSRPDFEGAHTEGNSKVPVAASVPALVIDERVFGNEMVAAPAVPERPPLRFRDRRVSVLMSIQDAMALNEARATTQNPDLRDQLSTIFERVLDAFDDTYNSSVA